MLDLRAGKHQAPQDEDFISLAIGIGKLLYWDMAEGLECLIIVNPLIRGLRKVGAHGDNGSGNRPMKDALATWYT